jgi:hypothetical protein
MVLSCLVYGLVLSGCLQEPPPPEEVKAPLKLLASRAAWSSKDKKKKKITKDKKDKKDNI